MAAAPRGDGFRCHAGVAGEPLELESHAFERRVGDILRGAVERGVALEHDEIAHLAAREGEAYQANDEFFGGAPVWQNFSTWLSQIPAVDYGIFTAEVDAAVQAQLPTIIEGGDIDAALQAYSARNLFRKCLQLLRL